jgi:uncharacterized YigZ family protein
MTEYKTAAQYAEYEILIKHSRFIGYIKPVAKEDEALLFIAAIRKKHSDATHNVYAYAIRENNISRYSDDGEPQGTAGLPMLEVLKHSMLSNVLFICTRYFGGTLLGAGGLVHAYTKSAADTLGAAQRIELIPCSLFRCPFSYGVWAKAEKALGEAGYAFEDITYADDVSAVVCVTEGREEAFAEHVKSLSLGKTCPILLGQKLTEVPVKL